MKKTPLDELGMRARWEAGESLAVLAAEAGLSRSQLWRRIGRPDAIPVDLVDPSALRGIIIPDLDVAFVAWAAGFFDGEGCVHAGFENAATGLRSRLQIIVVQTVPEPLVALQQRWGGRLTDHPQANPRHRHQWAWRLHGKNVAPFLVDVLPYLRVKHKVAALALEYVALIHQHRHRVTDADQAARTPIVEAIRALNRRGVA